MKILIVDDSEDSRDIAAAALLTAGYRDLKSAASALDAFDLLALNRGRRPPAGVDLILLDIAMPGIDGIEACRRIRSDLRYVDVPIIMITAMADMDSLAEAFVAGATDYISKPLNRVELLARVRTALKLKSELDRRRERERELLDFLSTWSDRRASVWIDDSTGLFVGEVAEAYLTAVTGRHANAAAVVALAVDGFEALRETRGEDTAREVLIQVTQAVQQTAATVGVIAASYRNGLIVLIVPEDGTETAQRLAETLRQAISGIVWSGADGIVGDRVTASMAIASGRVAGGPDRAKLITRAIATAQRTAETGGDRIIAAAA